MSFKKVYRTVCYLNHVHVMNKHCHYPGSVDHTLHLQQSACLLGKTYLNDEVLMRAPIKETLLNSYTIYINTTRPCECTWILLQLRQTWTKTTKIKKIKKKKNRSCVHEQQFNFLQMGKRVIALHFQFFFQLQKGYQKVARWYRQVGHLMLDRVRSS